MVVCDTAQRLVGGGGSTAYSKALRCQFGRRGVAGPGGMDVASSPSAPAGRMVLVITGHPATPKCTPWLNIKPYAVEMATDMF